MAGGEGQDYFVTRSEGCYVGSYLFDWSESGIST